MNIIKNLIMIDCKNGEDYLLVNGINGAIDIIHNTEKEIIEKWKKCDSIVPREGYELDLYEKLKKREYIMSYSEEVDHKNKIIERLQKKTNNNLFSTTAWFVLTYGCNFDCPYCYESKVKNNVLMTTEEVDQIFKVSNHEINKIGFFGGEPLLLSNRKIIEYIISKAPDYSDYYVITNGYYLNEFYDIFSSINTKNVQVTLDGFETQHNITRKLKNGNPTYNKILSGIMKYVESDIPVTIRMNVSLENIYDCFEEKKKIQCTEWGCKVKFELQPLFQTQPHSTNQLYNFMFSEDLKTGDNQILNKLLPISNYLYHGIPLKPILKICDQDGLSRFYDPYGNVYNCILAVGNENKSIGTYYPCVTVKERSFMTRDITKIEKCMSCAYSLFCGGGCPNGIPADLDVYSPNCVAVIDEIENTIPLVYKMRYQKNEK